MKLHIIPLLSTVLAAALATGCTSARLEYDRMTGTDFPNPETVSGEEVNFTTIFLQGDILLSVEEDDTNISPLTGPADPTDPNQYDYITIAELETLATANRDDPVDEAEWACEFWIFDGTCTRYHLWGVVVDHYYERSNGTRSTSTMGIMYDVAQRSAFANFYKHSTVSGNNAKFLRSAAHEAGHGFNLAHCDGDGSSTIMNQTGVVGSSFSYDFSSSSLTHLQDHDPEDVWPGQSDFDSVCPHNH